MENNESTRGIPLSPRRLALENNLSLKLHQQEQDSVSAPASPLFRSKSSVFTSSSGSSQSCDKPNDSSLKLPLPKRATSPSLSMGTPSLTRHRAAFRSQLSRASSMVSMVYERTESMFQRLFLKKGQAQAFISGFLLPCYSYLYKGINDKIARCTVLSLRGFMQCLTLVFVAKFLLNKNFFRSRKKEGKDAWTCLFFLLVVVFGGIRLCLMFLALNLVPLTIVSTMMNGTPVVVMLLSTCLLKERMTALKVIACVLLILGVLLNSNPYEAIMKAVSSSNLEESLGVAVTTLVIVFSALGSIFTKKITKTVEKMYITSSIGASIFFFALASTPLDEPMLSVKLTKINHGVMSMGLSQMGDMRLAHPKADLFCVLNETGTYLLQTEWDNNNTLYKEVGARIGGLMLAHGLESFNVPKKFHSMIEMEKEAQAAMLNDSLTVVFESLPNATLDGFMGTCETNKPPYLPEDLDVWCMAIVVASFGVLQQYLLIAAIQNTTATKATMIRSVSILFSFFFTILETDSIPQWNQWLGGILIFCAIASVSWEEIILEKVEANSRLKTFCGCILPDNNNSKSSKRKSVKDDLQRAKEAMKNKKEVRDIGIVVSPPSESEDGEKRIS